MSRRQPGLRPGARLQLRRLRAAAGVRLPPAGAPRSGRGSGGHGQVTTIGSRAAGWAGTDGVPVAQPPPAAGAPQSGRSSGGHEQLKLAIWL